MHHTSQNQELPQHYIRLQLWSALQFWLPEVCQPLSQECLVSNCSPGSEALCYRSHTSKQFSAFDILSCELQVRPLFKNKLSTHLSTDIASKLHGPSQDRSSVGTRNPPRAPWAAVAISDQSTMARGLSVRAYSIFPSKPEIQFY